MPKMVDHDARREHIVDVTWALIVEGGPEAATMREIAARAGFANGALKHYFPSKEDIVQSTFDRALSRMRRHVALEPTDRGVRALAKVAAGLLPLDPERVIAGRVLLAYWEICLTNPVAATKYARHLAAWNKSLVAHLREGREDGEIRTVTPDAQLADEIIRITAGANVMALFDPRGASPKLLKAQLDRYLATLA